jgi:hypothetical protein
MSIPTFRYFSDYLHAKNSCSIAVLLLLQRLPGHLLLQRLFYLRYPIAKRPERANEGTFVA